MKYNRGNYSKEKREPCVRFRTAGSELETRAIYLSTNAPSPCANERVKSYIFQELADAQLLSASPRQGVVEPKPRIASARFRSVSLSASSINSRRAGRKFGQRKIHRAKNFPLFGTQFPAHFVTQRTLLELRDDFGQSITIRCSQQISSCFGVAL
jgi:hypothetical protein